MSRIKKQFSVKKVSAPKIAASSAADILGSKKVAVTTPREDNTCVNCGKVIPQVRLDALKMLGTPRTQWTHTSCSTTSKIKGIYMGEVGTSKLQLCDKIYNDSVRSVFKKSTVEPDNDDSEPEEKDDR